MRYVIDVTTGETVELPDEAPLGDSLTVDELDQNSLNAALIAPGSVVRALGLAEFKMFNALALITFDGVNEARVRDGLTPYTQAQFRTALLNKWGQEMFTLTEFTNLLKAQMR